MNCASDNEPPIRAPRRGLSQLAPFVACAVLLLGGCTSEAERRADRGIADYFAGDYIRSVRELAPEARETNENFVLNNDRLGSAALAAYDLDDAESAFLRAYEVINSVGVNGGGRSLGAVLVDERIKVWKGEPFERAMTNFYLGLIYYARHDYGNARAAFENSLFKLRDYGEGSNPQDPYSDVENNFALGYLMLAKSWQRLGRAEKAHDVFEHAAKLRPDLAGLANEQANEKSNVLLVVDFGYGPEKLSTDDGAVVGFGPTPGQAGPIPLPFVSIDRQQIYPGPRSRIPSSSSATTAKEAIRRIPTATSKAISRWGI